MLKNYLKISWRNLKKNKIFSMINIIGLSLGMAACLLILEYVSFKLSYDRFNERAQDIYRVYNDRFQNGKLIQHGTITYSAIGKAMQDDFPEVVNHARLVPNGKTIVTLGLKKIGELQMLLADEQFLQMFDYPLIAGNKKTALLEPHTIVISETTAKKIFGAVGSDPNGLLGKAIMLSNDSTLYKITGICKDVPENSHLGFDMLASYVTLYTGENSWKEAEYDFKDSDFWHYVQLKPGTDYKKLEAKLDAFSQRHFEGNKVSGSDEKFFLQPLLRAHLYSDFEYEIGNTGSSTVVWGLLLIAVLIIIIAWFNYINLATAKSLERAREVGVRKVVGATQGQLIRQFLSESLIINLIAFVISIVLVLLCQSAFNNLLGINLSFANLFGYGISNQTITLGLVVLLLVGILISGFYPALVLSSFRPILVLKGKFVRSAKGIILRKVLVVGQFAITVALIIGSIVIYRQIKFLTEQELGMNISQVLVVKPPELTRFDSTFIDRENSFIAKLQTYPRVLNAATSWNTVGGETGRSFNIRRTDQDPNIHYTMRHDGISPGWIKLYQVKLLAGRDYVATDYNTDFGKLHNLIINESATKLLGFAKPEDAIGKSIFRGSRKWDIVGVIADYHQKSLRYPVEPTILMPAYGTGSAISVRVDTKDLDKTIASLKLSFDEFFPGNLFDYYFLDEQFNKQYSNDQLFGKAFAIFAGFAIFIASLGLLGLSLFAATQRTKEIGVRKVLGASVSSIVVLISKDFVKLVLLAFLIACPLAWYIMHGWLQDFAYRTNISWWIFPLAGALSLVIALATISFQAIKAGNTNPVRSLRTE
jgi:putative ABC transport system permease protein